MVDKANGQDAAPKYVDPDKLTRQGIPLSKVNDIELLRDMAEKLWSMLDDIDTYDDMVKDDINVYRALVQKKQSERFKILASDGYDLFLPISKS